MSTDAEGGRAGLGSGFFLTLKVVGPASKNGTASEAAGEAMVKAAKRLLEYELLPQFTSLVSEKRDFFLQAVDAFL